MEGLCSACASHETLALLTLAPFSLCHSRIMAIFILDIEKALVRYGTQLYSTQADSRGHERARIG